MQLFMDFSVILGAATLICGAIWAVDSVCCRPKRLQAILNKSTEAIKPEDAKRYEPKLVEYARSFFPILLFVFLLRSFLGEPFRIPSGSMKPTLLVGDFIVVNKYAYGLRLPLFANKITQGSPIQRGDVVVFRFPNKPSIDMIKRVIGLPGDKIAYKNKELYINGELVPRSFIGSSIDMENGFGIPTKEYQENLPEKSHRIFLNPREAEDMKEITVPKGHYFMMGDNRDNSDDSRSWGVVPDRNILGKAVMIWLSWDGMNNDVRWQRFGTKIN